MVRTGEEVRQAPRQPVTGRADEAARAVERAGFQRESEQPFRLVQDVTILGSREAEKLLTGQSSIVLSATLEYQACDDKVCYTPQRVPLKWTLPLKTLLRK